MGYSSVRGSTTILWRNQRLGGQVQIDRLMIFLVFLIGIFLRFFKISSLSLWADEGFSINLATASTSTIISSTAADVHPPLYYILLKYWILLFGSSEFAVRSLSAVLGSIALLLIYSIAKSIFNEKIAILAAFLSAVSPFLIWYSQETRAYSLLLVLTLASTYFLIRFLKTGRSALIPYVFVAVLSAYTHYYALWVLLVHNLYLMISWRSNMQNIKGWIIAQALLALSFLPWIIVAARQFYSEQGERAFSILSIAKVYLLLIMGRSLDIFRIGKVIHAERGNKFIDGAVVVLAALVIGYLLIRAIIAVRQSKHQFGTLAIMCLIVPPLAAGMLSLVKPVFDSKSLITVFPALAILSAHGILLHSRRIAVMLTAVIALCFCYSAANYYFNPYPWKEDFRGMVGHMKSNVGRDEIIVLQPSYLDCAFKYYCGCSVNEDGVCKFHDTHNQVREAVNHLPASTKGVWLIASAHPDTDINGHTKLILERGFKVIKEKSFSGFNVIYYGRK